MLGAPMGLPSIQKSLIKGHSAYTDQPYNVCTVTAASRLKAGNFLPRGSKNKNHAFHQNLHQSVVSMHQVHAYFRCAHNRSMCPNASVPFSGKHSWLKPRFSEVPAWRAEPLTDTRNIQLVLVNPGVTRTNGDLHHPTKLEHFFLHVLSMCSLELY